jgi:hypothetical protein
LACSAFSSELTVEMICAAPSSLANWNGVMTHGSGPA